MERKKIEVFNNSQDDDDTHFNQSYETTTTTCLLDGRRKTEKIFSINLSMIESVCVCVCEK